MSLTGNSISIWRMAVEGRETHPPEEIFQKLATEAFNPEPLEVAETNVGFVNFFNLSDNDFSNLETFYSAPFLFFGVRCDQRKISKSLLSIEVGKAEAEYFRQHEEVTSLSKEDRERLVSQVYARLLAQTPPSPALYQIVWNLESNELLIGTHNKKMLDNIQILLQSTLQKEGIRFHSVAPIQRSTTLLEASQRDELNTQVQNMNMAQGDAVLENAKDNIAIWQDFLAWLLFRSYTTDSAYQNLDQEKFVAFVDKKLVASGVTEEGLQKITITGPQDRLGEVRCALASGKNLEGVIVQLDYGDDRPIEFFLDALWMSLGRLKIPLSYEEIDPDSESFGSELATLLIRLAEIERVQKAVDSLALQFLEARVSESWGNHQKKLYEWLQGESASAAKIRVAAEEVAVAAAKIGAPVQLSVVK